MMITKVKSEISTFANAIGVDPMVMIDFIDKVLTNANEDVYIAFLSKLKILYFDRCIISKESINLFVEELIEVGRFIGEVRQRIGELDFELMNKKPLFYMIVNKLTEQQKLYNQICILMRKSDVKKGIELLDNLLNKYAISQLTDL